jgi:hypothetical protein
VENAANIFDHRNLIWYVVRQVPVEKLVTVEKFIEVRLLYARHRHACVQTPQMNAKVQVARGKCCKIIFDHQTLNIVLYVRCLGKAFQTCRRPL